MITCDDVPSEQRVADVLEMVTLDREDLEVMRNVVNGPVPERETDVINWLWSLR